MPARRRCARASDEPRRVALAAAGRAASPSSPPPPSGDDLEKAAPVLGWVPEGGADAHSSDVDPRREQRKIRRAAITSVAGGAIAIVGAGGLVGGALMIYLSKAKLGELADANGGHLPPGDAARQRAIATWQAAPIVLGVSAGVLVVGAVMAAVGAAKVRRLRENRRTTVAFSPAAVHGGLGIGARF